MDDWAPLFPDLFGTRFEQYADADLEFRLGPAPDEHDAEHAEHAEHADVLLADALGLLRA